jgi:hypothetical protein
VSLFDLMMQQWWGGPVVAAVTFALTVLLLRPTRPTTEAGLR